MMTPFQQKIHVSVFNAGVQLEIFATSLMVRFLCTRSIVLARLYRKIEN